MGTDHLRQTRPLPPGPARLRLEQWLLLSFFPSPSLVELKSDRGKSGAGLWPGRLGSQRLGRFLLEEPGLGPRGAEVGHPGNGRFVSGQSREGANCRGGAGGGGGPGEPKDT